MKQYETRTETTTREVCVKQTCDLCGNDVDSKAGLKDQYGGNVNQVETTIEADWGWSCPDGGWGHKIEVDLCVRCFLERLVPWLESQGAKVEKKEWDW